MNNLTQTLKQSIRLHAGDTKVLHLLQLMEERHGWLRSATMRRQARQALYRTIPQCAVPYDPSLHHYVFGMFDGDTPQPGDLIMPIITWSRDCDCAESTGISYTRASLHAFDRYCEWVARNAEGPWSLHIATPSEVAAFQPTHRDRVLEAFEDGHAYNV